MAEENLYQSGASAVRTVENELKRDKGQARRTVENLKAAGASMAEEYRDKAGQAWDNARTQAGVWREDGEDFVRENPVKTVVTALALGVAIGLLIRR
jgi:ElaB/YqjD/DUF883 family membrane-anchored ribosome-binding protein